MKFSNIWKAYASSLVGVIIGIISAAGTALYNNNLDWKAILVGAVPALVLATTDVLKEVQKSLNSESK